MKDLTRRLFNPTSSDAIEREVEEELRFHLDSLTEQQLQNVDTLEEARAAALRRFGNVEQVKDECVEISERRRPFTRAEVFPGPAFSRRRFRAHLRHGTSGRACRRHADHSWPHGPSVSICARLEAGGLPAEI